MINPQRSCFFVMCFRCDKFSLFSFHTFHATGFHAVSHHAHFRTFFFFLLVALGVPSSPRNVMSVVNETSVILEWHSPRETGGRLDVVYNIVCKKCNAERRACSHCDDSVDFAPQQLGLTDTRVFISNLWAHTLYTFEIQAVNGVTNKSPYPAQHVSVDITTNQAGKRT